MKKIIGIALLLLSVYLGYTGISLFSDSTASVDILGMELKAEDTSQKTTSYLYLGFAVLSAIGGIAMVKGPRK
jgi:hypothetical protein